ncbi:MAG TPA: hypothetical protein VMZ53_33645 [Kofleriaceae bacterium]|nr:hypothetical protein [Kofleriaceae bacterium]
MRAAAAAVLLAAVLAASSSRAAHAQVSVAVQLNADGEALASQLGITSQDLASRIQDRVNDAYDAQNVAGFIRSFTDATSFSTRGLGVDYASLPKNLILGVGANFAVAASGDFNADERPTAGLAANVSFMAGMNLADYDAPRWTLFANGFYRKATLNSLRGGITTAGLHAQYRLLQPQRDEGVTTQVLRWTGMDITSGLEFTRWNLGVDDDIETPFGVDGTSGGANLLLQSTGTFDLSSTAMTVPVEVSTGIRIALLVSVYIGAGVDFTASSGKLTTNLAGDLLTEDNRNIGTTTITGGGNNSGSPVAARVMAGAQLNIWKLRAYVQLNASATPAASIGAGIRGVL